MENYLNITQGHLLKLDDYFDDTYGEIFWTTAE